MDSAFTKQPRLSRGTFLIALAAGSFIIRLAFILALRDIAQKPLGSPSNDDVQFDHLAWSLARGDGFLNVRGEPTSFRAPGFPMFLAGLYWLTGSNPVVAYLSFCLLGALSSVLTYFLARELLAETPARWAGALSALYLGHVYFAMNFVSENPFVPLFILGLWLQIRFLKHGAWTMLALAGLTLGLATMIRPFALLTLPLFSFLKPDRTWYRPGRFLLSGLAFGLPFLGCIAPWTYRNYLIHDQFVLIASNGGSTFYGGNNDIVAGTPRLWGYWVSTTELPGRDLIEAQPNEVAHDQMEWRLGKEWVLANPGKAARLCVFKFGRLWVGPPEFDGGYYILRGLGYAPFLILMVLGGWRCVRDPALRTPAWWTLHLTVLATVVTALIFWGSARFRDANLGALMVYAALGGQTLVCWWQGSRKRRFTGQNLA